MPSHGLVGPAAFATPGACACSACSRQLTHGTGFGCCSAASTSQETQPCASATLEVGWHSGDGLTGIAGSSSPCGGDVACGGSSVYGGFGGGGGAGDSGGVDGGGGTAFFGCGAAIGAVLLCKQAVL